MWTIRKRVLRTGLLAALSALVGASVTGSSGGATWPAYRGPDGTGISHETGLLKAWPEGGPRVLWRMPLGDGYSGISVSGTRLYTMYSTKEDEIVACHEAVSGKELWRSRIDSNRPDDQGDGPRSTPTIDGDRVYALGARGKLLALEASTGKTVWKKDLKKDFGARVPRWGISTSPFIEGDLLLLDAGGSPDRSIIALNKKDGSMAWSARSDKPGYSTPISVTFGGRRQVLFFTGSALVSIDPSDGRQLWDFKWKTSYDINAAMPIFVPPDRVFISSGYDVGAALLQVNDDDGRFKIVPVWRSRVMKNHFNSSILHDGHLYGFDYGTLKCIDANTGQEKWGQRGFAKGSLLLADGHLIILSEGGLLALAEATPDGFQEKGRVQILEGRTWTMPSLSNKTLYLRNREEMVALDLAGSEES